MKLRFTAITLCAMLLAEIAHASDIVIFDAEKNIGTPSTKVRKEGRQCRNSRGKRHRV